jgi:uncharacterized protein YggE
MSRIAGVVFWSSLALTAMALPAAAQAPGDGRPSLRVSGQATVAAAPDQAQIDVGVVTRAETAERAAADNASRVDRVLAQLKRLLGPAAEISSVGYTLRPDYARPEPGREPAITGYTATNMVRVTVPELTKVGDVIDTATRGGANRVERIQLSLQQEDAVQARALRAAAGHARARAETLAAALGLRIGQVLFASEKSPPVRPFVASAQALRAEAATPIEPGPIEIRATVTLVVEVSAAAPSH